MAFTYGFYNSINGDRRYDALQMSSIFDGIIRDGIFMHYGGRFAVTPQEGMNIKVDTGRAWFNHTWNLNDNYMILPVDRSELSLPRIDTVVLEVNSEESSSEDRRTNQIKIVKGKAGSNPSPPTLVKANGVYQYPIADITIRAGSASIEQRDIKNRVGTSDAPYVTGPLELMNVDELIAQWQDEWRHYYETTEASWNAWFGNATSDWDSWFGNASTAWEQYFNDTQNAWSLWFEAIQSSWTDELTNMTNEFNVWFAASQIEWVDYKAQLGNEWTKFLSDLNDLNQANLNDLYEGFLVWFNNLRDVMDENTELKLQNQIQKLEEVKTGILLASGWVSDNEDDSPPYRQEVSILGVEATDRPVVTINFDPDTEAEKRQLLKEWGCIDLVDTINGGAMFYCKFVKPSIDIPFAMKGR